MNNTRERKGTSNQPGRARRIGRGFVSEGLFSAIWRNWRALDDERRRNGSRFFDKANLISLALMAFGKSGAQSVADYSYKPDRTRRKMKF